jgi:hypothetical protein
MKSAGNQASHPKDIVGQRTECEDPTRSFTGVRRAARGPHGCSSKEELSRDQRREGWWGP